MNKLLNYLKGAKEELAKVVWPTKDVTVKHTLVVIVISIAVAIFLGSIDFLLNEVLEILIK
tara:strand:+ start:1083 stop:1265 length:183 start_codon:yes stop_codon:yes gene_type:complete